MKETLTCQDVTVMLPHQASPDRLASLPGPHCSAQMQHAAAEQVLAADRDWHDAGGQQSPSRPVAF